MGFLIYRGIGRAEDTLARKSHGILTIPWLFPETDEGFEL